MDETANMQRDVFIVAVIVLSIGIILIPVSQWPQSETRDRLVGKQIVQIPEGETSFMVNLESETRYRLFVKGGLITSSDSVGIDVLTPDNSSFWIEFPIDDPKVDLTTSASSGYYNFTLDSAYGSSNTRAELSEITSWEHISHPYADFLFVGIAFVIVGVVFTVVGLKYPIGSRTVSQ